MKALVTGGAGFIGSHLCELLLSEGHEVVALDNLACGRLSNFRSFERHASFRFVQADIRDLDTIRPAFAGIDWVFHLAGLADIVPSIEQPAQYFQHQRHGHFQRVGGGAREQGVKRLVYAASSSSYGIPDAYPTPETAEIRAQYPYALTKHMGEELVLHWAQTYKMSALSLPAVQRLWPAFSAPTGAYGAVFGVFLAQKLNGKPFTMVGRRYANA